MSEQQTKFEGWAIVDVLGHQRHSGFVTTEYFGSTAFFKVETPARDRNERVLSETEWVNGTYGLCPKGTKVVTSGSAVSVVLIGAGSVYAITPSTREAVLGDLEERSPLRIESVLSVDGATLPIAEMPF